MPTTTTNLPRRSNIARLFETISRSHLLLLQMQKSLKHNLLFCKQGIVDPVMLPPLPFVLRIIIIIILH